jgi:hypothetical protein
MKLRAALLFVCLALCLSAGSAVPLDWPKVLDVLADPQAAQEVAIILHSYGDFIQDVAVRRGDVAFRVNGDWVYFQDGRLLAERNLPNSHRYDSLFTEYDNSGPVETLPRGRRLPRSRDFLRAMFGRSESQVRRHCVTMTFLNHEVTVNRVCAPELRKIEREIYAAAEYDPEVKDFIRDMDVIYSFHRKTVKGSRALSFHAYGLALDLIPPSYENKHANWRWSRAWKRSWYRIPLEERWRPPAAVLNAFKRHGFIWGGDWIRFDAVHFEFRPEIAYKRLPDPAVHWLGGQDSSLAFYK